MSKKTHNPIPTGTKTLQDILPDTQKSSTHSNRNSLQRRIINKDPNRYAVISNE